MLIKDNENCIKCQKVLILDKKVLESYIIHQNAIYCRDCYVEVSKSPQKAGRSLLDSGSELI